MKAIILFLLLALGGQAQNLIQNGTDFIDSNNDGVADYWTKGILNTTVSVSGGYQYCFADGSPCSQASVKQILNISNSQPKRYLVTFDLQCGSDVWVIANYSANAGVNLMTVKFTDSGWHSYSVEYNQNNISAWDFYSLQFCSPTGYGWFMLDNVSMTEIVSVGIQETASKQEKLRSKILSKFLGEGFYATGRKLCYNGKSNY